MDEDDCQCDACVAVCYECGDCGSDMCPDCGECTYYVCDCDEAWCSDCEEPWATCPC